MNNTQLLLLWRYRHRRLITGEYSIERNFQNPEFSQMAAKTFTKFHIELHKAYAVEPVSSGHHWGMKFCPLWRGGLIFQGLIYTIRVHLGLSEVALIEGCPHVRGDLYEEFHCRFFKKVLIFYFKICLPQFLSLKRNSSV